MLAGAVLDILAGSSIALLLLEADGVQLRLADGQLGRQADGFDVPPTAGVGLDCAPRVAMGKRGDRKRHLRKVHEIEL